MPRSLFLVPILVLACSACGDCARGFSAGFSNSFDEEFRKSYAEEFTSSCTKAAVEQGAEEATVAPVCRCFADTLLEQNETTDVMKASMKPEGEKFQAMLRRAEARCTAEAAQRH